MRARLVNHFVPRNFIVDISSLQFKWWLFAWLHGSFGYNQEVGSNKEFLEQLYNYFIYSFSVILPSVNEVDMFKCLLPILPHVQLVWELVLVAEPLVVMTPSPTQCSQTTQSLVSLILPLKFKPVGCLAGRRTERQHDYNGQFKLYGG